VNSKTPGSATTRGPTVRVGRYELTSELFRSELDTLWSGHATGGDEDTPVLVRRIMKRPPVTEQAFQAITEAAFSVVDVRHPRIAAVTDVVVTTGEIAVVSEYTPGKLLLRVQQAAKLKQNPIPVSAALRLAVDLLDGLAASNTLFGEAEISEERLYGGLTPDFAWVTQDGDARLLDLAVGLAIAADQKLARLPHFLAYRSPERLTGSADARADVFAVGVMLWELLANRSQIPVTGRPDPHKSPKPIVRLDSLTRSDAAVISKELADLVARALDMDPAGRFASPQEMADAIHALGADRIAPMADVKAAVERLSQPAAAIKTAAAASTAKPPGKPAAVLPPSNDAAKAARLPPPKAPVKPAPPKPAAAPPKPAAAPPKPEAGERPEEEATPITSAPPTAITALFDDLVLPVEPEAAEAPTIAEVPRFDSGPVAELLSSPSIKAINASARPVANRPRRRWRLAAIIAVAAAVVAAVAALAIVLLAPQTAGNDVDLSWASKRNPFARLQIFRGATADAGPADAGSDAGKPDAGDRVPGPHTAPAQPDDQGEPGGHDRPAPKKRPFMPTAI
jgi:hypothetical protein